MASETMELAQAAAESARTEADVKAIADAPEVEAAMGTSLRKPHFYSSFKQCTADLSQRQRRLAHVLQEVEAGDPDNPDWSRTSEYEGDSAQKLASWNAEMEEFYERTAEKTYWENFEAKRKLVLAANEQAEINSIAEMAAKSEGREPSDSKPKVMPFVTVDGDWAVGQPVEDWPAEARAAAEAARDIGEMFVQKSVERYGEGERLLGDFQFSEFDFKTLLTTGVPGSSTIGSPVAGAYPSFSIRTGQLVRSLAADYVADALDVLPSKTVRGASFEYHRETSTGNAAMGVAEGGTYPDDTFTAPTTEETLKKISVSMGVTDETVEDHNEMIQFIRDMLLNRRMRPRLALYALNGLGVDNTRANSNPLTARIQLKGILNDTAIGSVALGSNGLPTGIGLLVNQVVEQSFGEISPNVMLMNLTDWTNVQTLQETTGAKLIGSYEGDTRRMLFDTRVVPTSNMPQGQVLAMNASEQWLVLALRRGIRVAVTDSHGTDFLEGKQRARADQRAEMCIKQPLALAKLTGVANIRA